MLSGLLSGQAEAGPALQPGVGIGNFQDHVKSALNELASGSIEVENRRKAMVEYLHNTYLLKMSGHGVYVTLEATAGESPVTIEPGFGRQHHLQINLVTIPKE